jgi:phosphatidylinositol alpha-1,6-mannosyltransferase
MNILFFAYDFEWGGIARYSREVAEGLGRLGHKVFVVSDFTKTIPAPIGERFFSPVSFRKKELRSPFFWLDFLPLFRLAKKLSIDMMLLSVLFPYGPMALFLSRSAGIPFSIFVHGAELYPQKPKTKWIVSRIFQKASSIVCVSGFTRTTLLKRFPRSRNPVVIPPGTHPEVFKPVADREGLLEKHGLKGRKVILTASRLVRRKGQAQVIRALPKIMECVPEVLYLVVGSGPAEPGLRALTGNMGLSEHVRFLGYVADENLPELYALCDVFVLPSTETTDTESGSLGIEGFPAAFLEASACGRPVVAGKSGGSAEAVLDGVTGLSVDGESVEQIADAVLKLLLDEELANRLGQNGRNRVEKEFSWNAIVRRIEKEICG